MNLSLAKLDPGKVLLLSVAAVIALGLLMIHYMVMPAYGRWQSLRETVNMQELQYATLSGNLALEDEIEKQFNLLGPVAEVVESDEIVLSRFFRQIESMASKRQGLKLVNMKPRPVKNEKTHQAYPIKLVVAGQTQEVLRFVTDVVSGASITGVDGFSLRGVQGGGTVECSLSLFMIRLIPQSSFGARTLAVRHRRQAQ